MCLGSEKMFPITNILGFGIISSFFNLIPYSLLVLPISFLFQQRIRIFTLTKKEDCLKLQSKINSACTHSTEKLGYGYSCGFWYILHLGVSNTFEGTTYNAWILCTKNRFDELMKEETCVTSSEELVSKKKPLPKELFFVLEKSSGTYANIYYRMRALERYSITPTEQQQKIIDHQIEIFTKKKSAVFFLSGPCGRGKSMTAVFLAKALSGMYCEDCTPWEPGDSIQSMYMDFQVQTNKENKPLIVCLDEIDVVLEKMHANKIPNNETVQTSVRDKVGWNKLFSKIERGLFPNLIIVMTSNKSPEEIKKDVGNDPSLLRLGRVDRFFTL